jgi:hypothetical protein
MGIDCRLTLAPNARVQDVASVLGILFGLPCALEPLDGGGVVCQVRGVRVVPAGQIPEMCFIELRAPNGDLVARSNYHFENPGGRRLISARARAETLAAFRRVADFFGGVVDDMDCDDEAANYVAPDRGDAENHPSDGAPWNALQRRMAAVLPLTEDAIAACRPFAAY